MAISKITAGTTALDPAASTGAQVATAVNKLIDATTGVETVEAITLKGLPNTSGAPAGYGDLTSAVAASKNTVYTLGTVGDSRLANAYRTVTNNRQWRNQMVVSWLRALSGQRVDMPPQFSLATSGATTAQVLLQAEGMAALSVKPDFCLINGGTNDFAASATLQAANDALNNIASAASTLAASGITPIIEIDVPRSGGGWSTGGAIVSAEFNRMLRNYCFKNNVLLCDYETLYIVADGNPAAGFNVADGIHPSCTGSSVRAMKYLEVLKPMMGDQNLSMATARDTYDVTLNPYGNMILNGLFTGTTGANLGSGASGVVPTGWQNRVISGTATAVASKLSPESSSAQSERMQVVINFTTDGEYRFRPEGSQVGGGAVIPAGLTDGEPLEAWIDIEIVALSGTITDISLTIFDIGPLGTASTATDFFQDVSGTGNPLPLVPLAAPNGVGNIYDTLKLRLKTPVFRWRNAPSNLSTQLMYQFTVLGRAGSSCTLLLSNAQIRKVA